MKNLSWYLILLALALFAIPAHGQDSVSNNPTGTPVDSDAVYPFDIGEQVNTYVVDMTPFTTSWGTRFGMAPLVKSSSSTSDYFNNLLSAQFISQDVLKDVRFPFSNYSYWNAPGYGINSLKNDVGTDIDVSGKLSNQFAVTFEEYDTVLLGDFVTTAVVNYRLSRPDRLYVSRINSAVNGQSLGYQDASFGLGAVDAHANTYFRADGFNVGGLYPLVGQNLYRVRALERISFSLNIINSQGPSDAGATDWLINGAGTNTGCPNCVPEGVGNHPLFFAGNWNDELVYESAPNTVSTTTAHSATSHRGSPSYSKFTLFPGTVGTGTMTAKDTQPTSTSRRVLLWGIDGNGAVSGTAHMEPPASIVDNDDAYDFPKGGNVNDYIGWFISYGSQLFYRGGCGPHAIGMDQEGRAIVAVHVSQNDSTNDGSFNALAVARFDPSNPPPAGAVEWTLAGYVDDDVTNPSNGKLILDGPGGLPVGKQCALAEVTGGAPFGPSIGLPMIDSAGNIWFITAAELFKGTGSDFDSVLVRAVYDPDTFSYQLEKVFELGSIFHGRNSDLDYMITFCGIADSNSFSSGTAFAGNMNQNPWGNRASVELLDTRNPQTLGGMVFNAEITYDVDKDGDFDYKVPGAPGYDPTSIDEEYNCLMYIGWPGNKVGVGDSPDAREKGNNADPAVPPTGSGKATTHG